MKYIRGLAGFSAMLAIAAVLSLGGCDWIKSFWKSEAPASSTSGPVSPPAPAPAAGKVEMAKPDAVQPPESAKGEDSVLAASVKSALGEDPELKELAIDVGVVGGVVTLFGTANTLANRAKAEQLASRVPGVKSVNNQLVIIAGS
jgi:osmotically-inducible protein OsmY